MPTMQPVDSTNIEAMGYDLRSKELHIRFKSGGTYIHSNVPPEEAKALHLAASKGGHYQAHIRGKYESRKA